MKKIAAITFVYNENVNLPIWIKHYGGNFGFENLFIVDRQSNDGSTADVAPSNVLRVPRGDFDDFKKISCINGLHFSLLQHYDTVIISDYDEIIVPDPAHHGSLREYVDKLKVPYINCIGLNVFHIINNEEPINLNKPILSQRSIAEFDAATCKPMISSIPTRWCPGGHSCSNPPQFDETLFMFHLKVMDYSIAMARQVINRETLWSGPSLAGHHGAHHRYENERFVREGFLDPLNEVNNKRIFDFKFSEEIESIKSRTVKRDNDFITPMDIKKIVRIPERFGSLL